MSVQKQADALTLKLGDPLAVVFITLITLFSLV